MTALTKSMCWRLEKKEKDALNKVGVAIFRKPTNNQCYDQRKENKPPMCKSDDDPDAAWLLFPPHFHFFLKTVVKHISKSFL